MQSFKSEEIHIGLVQHFGLFIYLLLLFYKLYYDINKYFDRSVNVNKIYLINT